ncbi:MAG TPA: cation:proton antiporter subunit C [Thermoanaerobaculia bacterium]|nr:cation:proton antiporter subunit C [Thermoanaerobaculia bacterium]
MGTGWATEGLWIYWAIIALMMTGLYILIARDNLVKKIIGLNIFQSSAILLFVALGKVEGGTAPILIEGAPVEGPGVPLYSNPIPHVLMLTAIVVGVATTALALALVVRIHRAYGTAEEDEIVAAELLRVAEIERAGGGS